MNTKDKLKNFDSLPNAASVDVHVVAALCGCSVSTAWKRSSRGALPKPRKIGGSTLWNVGELRAVLTGAHA
ncbi:transcriptional regulator [Burkholderia cenocepacia]|uniref:helix-turn-helix transcriptional regulator n=1 Tax=Burkholderia contaminans TaxID=488447 RepID=UPI0009D6DE01|nr:transcriptional regulator [Burkholderia contaminans]RQZ93668.1 transcriptional regulator [Burkholderia cenocepacia]RRA14444.1 transcriptional regulator [Burkholderia cenocepacia]